MKRLRFILIIAAIFLIFVPQSFAASLAAKRVVDEKVVTNIDKALPQSVGGELFTITGGPIEILSLTGEVTTVIETASNEVDLSADPTLPTGSATLLSVSKDITGDAVGTMYSMVTSIGTALAEYTGGVGPTMQGVFGVIVPAGAIDLRASASSTGNITWRLRYRPLHHGVTVVAN